MECYWCGNEMDEDWEEGDRCPYCDKFPEYESEMEHQAAASYDRAKDIRKYGPNG